MTRFILAAVVRRASLSAHLRMTDIAGNLIGLVSAFAWGLAGHISGCGCQDDDAALCSIGDGAGLGAGACKCECHKKIKEWDAS